MALNLKTKSIFCEDVRMEVSGQATIVGVFPGSITMSDTDNVLRVAQWVQVDGLEVGDYHVTVEAFFEGVGIKRIGELEVDIQVENSEFPVILTPVGLELFTKVDGRLFIMISFNGNDPIEVGSIPVQIKRQSDDGGEE